MATKKYITSGLKAHSKVSQAVKKGIIKRMPCSVCGTMDNVDAHHGDYRRPLSVVFLCKTHHSREHLRLRRIGKRSVLLQRYTNKTIALTEAEAKRVKQLKKKGVGTIDIFRAGLNDLEARTPKKL